jgi:hypothetical protein
MKAAPQRGGDFRKCTGDDRVGRHNAQQSRHRSARGGSPSRTPLFFAGAQIGTYGFKDEVNKSFKLIEKLRRVA